MPIIFNNLKARVANKINKSDAPYLVKIGQFINDRYDDVLSRIDWSQLQKHTTINAIPDSETLILAFKDLDFILDIHDRTNDVHIRPINASIAGRKYNSILDSPTDPTAFYWPNSTTVRAQPTSASVIAIVSSSASDTSQNVRVWGKLATGEVVDELVALTGVTPANTTNSYTELIKPPSKDSATVGMITGTSNSGAVTNFQIDPAEFASRYTQINLVPPESTARTLDITYKITTPELVENEDIALISCERALIVGAYADCLDEQRQSQKAIKQDNKYEQLVQRLIAKNLIWSDNVELMQPHEEKANIDRSNNFSSFTS